jgi:hypothetical protein
MTRKMAACHPELCTSEAWDVFIDAVEAVLPEEQEEAV